jgi:hypothetical protein
MAALLVCTLMRPAHVVAQQDSAVVVADSGQTNDAGNPLDWGKGEILKWLIPLVGSFLLRQWNKVNGWLAGWKNSAKIAVYTFIVTGMMLLGEWLHMAVSSNVADWGGAFFEGLVASALGAVLVKLGINTAREKLPATKVGW